MRPLLQTFAGPPIAAGPERAFGAGRPLIVDAFLMGAADDPIGHADAQDAMVGEKCRDVGQDLGIVANVAVRREPFPHDARVGVLMLDDRDDQLAGPLVVGTIGCDGRQRVSAKAPFGFLRQAFSQLLRLVAHDLF